MGGSEGSESGGIGGEWGVGTIVWVRRRNGSWWPGRILGQEELSASHLMSPRSGTPVKLLGREDASVDWYNLEKSKRVKAFRCGEFDTCIERAEASQGVPIKKREKYARREDAILHALELEKKMLDNNPQKIGSSTIKYSGALKEEQNEGFPSRNHLKNDVSAEHGTDGAFVNKSQLIYRKVDHFSEIGSKSTIYNIKGKGANHSSWDDDTWEEAPRMRELQDFGLQSAPSRRKIAASAANESTRRHFVVGAHSRALSGFSRSVEGATTVTTSKKFPPFKKQKIYGGFSEESSSKRQDRHHPLVQALRSSTKLSTEDHSVNLSNTVRSTYDTIPHNPNNSVDYTGHSSEQMQVSPVMLGYPGSLIEENSSSGLNEADESDTVEEVSSDDTEDDETLYRGHPQSLPHVSNNSRRYFEDDNLISFPDKDKYGNYDGHDGPLLPGYLYHQDPHQQEIGTSADLGVSKRDFKGKCNTRNLTKMPMEPMDDIPERFCYNSLNGRTCKSRSLSLKSNRERITLEQFHAKYDNLYQDDFIERDLSPQSRRSRSCNHSSILKRVSGYQEDGDINDSDEESLGMFLSISEDDEPPSTIPRGYWETEDYRFDQFYAYHLSGGLESMWVDVDLKVQATYQGERVPLVSLMSRLNGQAIIGHPLQIETLDDSFTNCLISNNSGEGPTSGEGNETPPPVWRTGRRTAMQRVPHPHPLPVALEGTENEPHLYSDSDIKPPFEKPYVVNFDNQTRTTKKSNSRRPVKFHKKASKKVSLSNQKIRRLSSFAIQHKHGRAKGKVSTKGCSILDGLMKPGVSPMVTCIPVKIVFSRILEAIGRSPSSTTTNRGVTVLYRSVLRRKETIMTRSPDVA